MNIGDLYLFDSGAARFTIYMIIEKYSKYGLNYIKEKVIYDVQHQRIGDIETECLNRKLNSIFDAPYMHAINKHEAIEKVFSKE